MGNVACTAKGGAVPMSLNTCVSAGALPCSTQSSIIAMKSTYAGTSAFVTGFRPTFRWKMADGNVKAQELVHHALSHRLLDLV